MRGIVVALVLLAAIPAHARISVDAGAHWDGDLSVHGRWVWTADVGEVWVPRVHVSWQPYLDGHWAWSPWGWMWVSHDPWGHLTDHYGRWLWTPHHGWVWVPGRVWSPAWVVWISGPGWIGWAPASPDWCYGYWRHADYHRHHGRWVMVNSQGFLSPSLSKERLPETRVKADFTREFDRRQKAGYTLGQAPERQTIERASGKVAAVVLERPGAERAIERAVAPNRDRDAVRERPGVDRERRVEPTRDRERILDRERKPPSAPAPRIAEPQRQRPADPIPRGPASSPGSQRREEAGSGERAAASSERDRGRVEPPRDGGGPQIRSRAPSHNDQTQYPSRR